jgi:hypothetical protein
MQMLNRVLVRNVLSLTSFDARRSSVQPHHSDAGLIIAPKKSAGADDFVAATSSSPPSPIT